MIESIVSTTSIEYLKNTVCDKLSIYNLPSLCMSSTVNVNPNLLKKRGQHVWYSAI